jgi:hypothetical protein
MKVRFRKREGLLTAGLFVVTGSWGKYDRVSQRKGWCFVLEPCNERLGGQRAILIRKRSSGSRLKFCWRAQEGLPFWGRGTFFRILKLPSPSFPQPPAQQTTLKGMEIYAELPMQKSAPNLVYGMRWISSATHAPLMTFIVLSLQCAGAVSVEVCSP